MKKSVLLIVLMVTAYFSRAQWEPDIRLTSNSSSSLLSYNKNANDIAVNVDTLLVVWTDNRDGNYEIYFKRSTDKGLTWDPDMRLTNAIGTSGSPSLAIKESLIYVSWWDARDAIGPNDSEIYYKCSTDRGLTWGPDIRLTNNAYDSWDPCISVKDSVLHIVWEDNRDGNYEIYYKHSTDGGLTWSADTRLTNATGDSKFSSVSSSGSMVHVVWQDIRDGNYEIYYKRNPTGNVPTGIDNGFISTSVAKINIFPNPASNIIHIRINNYSNEIFVLTISNIQGEELLKFQIQNSDTDIDVSMLPNGLFFAGITTKKKQVLKTKFIVVKD